MKIEIVGPGCPFCRRLHRRVEEVVREKGVGAQVLHVTDLGTALKYFPRTPYAFGEISKAEFEEKKSNLAGG